MEQQQYATCFIQFIFHMLLFFTGASVRRSSARQDRTGTRITPPRKKRNNEKIDNNEEKLEHYSVVFDLIALAADKHEEKIGNRKKDCLLKQGHLFIFLLFDCCRKSLSHLCTT